MNMREVNKRIHKLSIQLFEYLQKNLISRAIYSCICFLSSSKRVTTSRENFLLLFETLPGISHIWMIELISSMVSSSKNSLFFFTNPVSFFISRDMNIFISSLYFHFSRAPAVTILYCSCQSSFCFSSSASIRANSPFICS